MQGLQCSTSTELGRDFRGPTARRRERDGELPELPAPAGRTSPPLGLVESWKDRGVASYNLRSRHQHPRQGLVDLRGEEQPAAAGERARDDLGAAGAGAAAVPPARRRKTAAAAAADHLLSGQPCAVRPAAARAGPPAALPSTRAQQAGGHQVNSLRVRDGELVASPRSFLPTALSAEDPELFPTHNSNGFISTFLDPVTRDFIEFAGTVGGNVLDLGAGYGLAGLAALRAGASHVVLNDADPSHLAHLEPSDQLSLSTQPIGACTFPDGHFSAVLISRVLHLMDVSAALDVLERVRRWTRDGGRVFIACDTIFCREFAQFADEYRSRCQGGLQFPGLFARRMDARTTQYAAHVPATFHYFDIPSMVALIRGAGFCPEKVFYFSRPDYPAAKKTNGRDCLAAVASKMDLL